jgi:ribosomal protein S18 acetylase RimI-like enzyme
VPEPCGDLAPAAMRHGVDSAGMSPCEIRPFEPADFDPVNRLWAVSEGLGAGPGDTPEAVARFLARNPGLSLVAEEDGAVVAAVLCGHDGRRGQIYHLAVARSHRRRGLGEELVRRCAARLGAAGIERVLIRVQADNLGAREFWARVGGRFRDDLVEFTMDVGGGGERPGTSR